MSNRSSIAAFYELRRIALKMERFEASESRAKTGTGSRREGEHFEELVSDWWDAFAASLVNLGARRSEIVDPAGLRYARLVLGRRSIYLPARRPERGKEVVRIEPDDNRASWFKRVFCVRELVQAFPGEAEAVRRYAPKEGPFAKDRYPEMFDRMTTKFDGTVLLEEDDALKEKVLLEYKTAKSSKRHQIDGNAHERLSFQVLQYLEVATRFPRCSLIVFANGAFIRYRNKYHVSFHVQADRLTNFAWFHMEYLAAVPEYLDYAVRLADWLLRK